MENGENKDLQGRREFFKEAAKKALPILGAVAIITIPLHVDAFSNNNCNSSCENTCKGDCETSCHIGCGGGCTGTCEGTCKDTCSNTCKNMCGRDCTNGNNRNKEDSENPKKSRLI